MNIDWFTVAAQAFNFFVLIWLMKRFLYKPVLKAIDTREKRIADELANAETKKTAAEKQKEEYDRKNGEMNAQSAAFLKNAQDEGQAEKLKLFKEAHDEADALSAKRKEALAEEEKTLSKAVSRKTLEEVLALTRKIFMDLAGTSLDERVVGVFTRRLRNGSAAETKALLSVLKTQQGTVTVRTALDLSPELRASTEVSIKEIIGSQTNVIFESSPDLICGIELSVNGQKVAWSVADYLSTIEESFDAS